MAQYRQSGGTFFDKVGFRNDHVSVGIRVAAAVPHNHNQKPSRTSNHRRFRTRRISVLALVLMILTLLFLIFSSAFLSIFKDNKDNDENSLDDEFEGDLHFLANATRTEKFRALKFGHGLVGHGRDSRYWDKDDRRRDEDYNEESVEQSSMAAQSRSDVNLHLPSKRNDTEKKLYDGKKKFDRGVVGFYNEAGRNELKKYEAEYEASLKGAAKSMHGAKNLNWPLDGNKNNKHEEEDDIDDEYDDEIDMHDIRLEDYSTGLDNGVHSEKSKGVDGTGLSAKDHNTDGEVEEYTPNLSDNASLDPLDSEKKVNTNSRRVTVVDDQSLRRSTSDRRTASKKRPKHRKFSGSCEMKLLNSTTQLVEPPQSPKFARFSLQYMELEEKPNKLEAWEPRFAGHQSLEEREQSFVVSDQTINCGFVKGPKGSPSTGFDLAEDDTKYMSSCHIAVISCIFGNSDRLRSPTGKTVSRLSRKTICFVMFVDDVTLQTLTSEGQKPDRMRYIGLWKIVVVKNLPYADMRRVGKIPKLLPHRLFPSARYSIWLDSKLRLQLDPLLVLEYFLWRKGFEYAISNHYDRHCVWEEVAQNKKLNKYNHTIIDEQFVFYQADGLKRFNPMDPQKLLPSNVPEGSFIVRAHTPMSNLFSCLWFNEVERFTPRDQLSFAYTYQKLRRMNPTKPFHFNMFKDCERRKIAKLFRHRSEETRYTLGQAAE